MSDTENGEFQTRRNLLKEATSNMVASALSLMSVIPVIRASQLGVRRELPITLGTHVGYTQEVSYFLLLHVLFAL
jgi:hypothetical protein